MATDVGSLYRTSISTYDNDGNPVTPDTYTLTVTNPDQTTSTPAVSVLSEGNLYVDWPMQQEGLTIFQWGTTGPTTSKIDTENATIWRSIIGLQEMRHFLALQSTTQDDTLRDVLAAATVLVESQVGTCVIKTITMEHIPGTFHETLRLPSAPCPSRNAIIEIGSEWEGGPTWQPSDVILYPDSGVVATKSMLGFWFGPWWATYLAGRTVIPINVQLATKEIVWDLWANQRLLFADQMEPGLQETAQYDSMIIPPGYVIPPHAKSLLQMEMMPGFA